MNEHPCMSVFSAIMPVKTQSECIGEFFVPLVVVE